VDKHLDLEQLKELKIEGHALQTETTTEIYVEPKLPNIKETKR